MVADGVWWSWLVRLVVVVVETPSDKGNSTGDFDTGAAPKKKVPIRVSGAPRARLRRVRPRK